MYLVPVFVLLDADSAEDAKHFVERDLADRAVHVGEPRRLSQLAMATAEFDVRVYANNIEIPPARD